MIFVIGGDCLHQRIKEIRLAASLTQAAFARRIAIGRSSVAKIETGENTPSPQTQRLICQEFGINPEWLLTGKGEMYMTCDDSVEGLAAELLTSLRGNDFAIALYREVARRFTTDDWYKLRQCMEAALESTKKTK
jgi:transcriptional regulator with XRE-family HTH domain